MISMKTPSEGSASSDHVAVACARARRWSEASNKLRIALEGVLDLYASQSDWRVVVAIPPSQHWRGCPGRGELDPIDVFFVKQEIMHDIQCFMFKVAVSAAPRPQDAPTTVRRLIGAEGEVYEPQWGFLSGGQICSRCDTAPDCATLTAPVRSPPNAETWILFAQDQEVSRNRAPRGRARVPDAYVHGQQEHERRRYAFFSTCFSCRLFVLSSSSRSPRVRAASKSSRAANGVLREYTVKLGLKESEGSLALGRLYLKIATSTELVRYFEAKMASSESEGDEGDEGDDVKDGSFVEEMSLFMKEKFGGIMQDIMKTSVKTDCVVAKATEVEGMFHGDIEFNRDSLANDAPKGIPKSPTQGARLFARVVSLSMWALG